jgi:murein DD-endopeptidase MepM/ murein hydrolase activator NlpD
VTIATVTRTAGGESASATAPPGSTVTPGATADAAVPPQASPSADPTSTPAPPAEGSNALTGFIYPLVGACLPQGDQLMPNAPRTYRLGTHEGIDFYGVDNCTAIGQGTPVIAAKAGRVVRADHGYVDLTPQTLAAIFADPTSDASFDAFRGRQVWIDHGDGVVTRYCHLGGIVPELQVGDEVAQGTTIAYVGESGTPASVQAPGTEFHLHFEVRTGGSYLGAGQSPSEVRALYLSLFGQ